MNLELSKSIHLPAPEGITVYADATYARAEGASMVEFVRHATMHVGDGGAKHFYPRRLSRRRSTDNGRSWVDDPDVQTLTPDRLHEPQIYALSTILDAENDILIFLYFTHEMDLGEAAFARGNRAQRTQRTFYQLSHDGGATWSDPVQVIDSRSGYDETNWAPGVVYGTQGARSGRHVFLPNGTLVIGFDIMQPDQPKSFPPGMGGYYIETIYAQAEFSADHRSLDWRFGDPIAVEFPGSVVGCCEASLAWLGGTRLFNTMRCQGSEAHGIQSVRHTTVSDDGGLTWSGPRPLVYDDGETVWTPASVHQFYRNSSSGKTYVLANFLPGPVYGQTPRYPLGIAEFDTEQLCVVRDTVRVIQDLPEGAPKSRRYTNFGMYEDRETGELVLLMPEQPRDIEFQDMTRPSDFTSDCIEFRIRILD